MFANLTHWQWIVVAWAQLLLAYGAYLFYLSRLAKRNREGQEER